MSGIAMPKLPINRKEVFYTATVLPGIVCANDLAQIGPLLELFGVQPDEWDSAGGGRNIQFFTEYNARQSIYRDEDLKTFRAQILSNDTPDLLILLPGPAPILIGVEAKMFDSVTAAQLDAQLKRQRENVLNNLTKGIPYCSVRQVALVPGRLDLDGKTLQDGRVVTWEEVLKVYCCTPNISYFWGILKQALDHYHDLKNEKLTFGANSDGKLTGKMIVQGYRDNTIAFATMGRAGGLKGGPLTQDIANNLWEQRLYEVSKEVKPANVNWFTIAQFIENLKFAGRYSEH